MSVEGAAPPVTASFESDRAEAIAWSRLDAGLRTLYVS